MADRLKVIKGLYEAVRVINDHVPMRYVGYAEQACWDALALLREQEPLKPFYCEADDSWGCGNCGETVGYGELNPGGIDPVRNKYCPGCGRAVKWD